ncbi:hypothetical protein AMS68_007770 [Peltaster fructicola]|uniref:Uncharacterized protein n=1 Tax=Peltaster fructicola TaxID=286661 RepID=A0A6H0Y5H9_9PEZI|nr:hypothetical protein AMS68_007770 [Peltaster fructicola]
MAAIRSLAGASSFALHSRQLQGRLVPLVRTASTTSPPKPRLLEKPERFNPPSHGQRLKQKPKTYGAPLSEAAREAQKTKQYPHMMPPQGTFLHWFLTNRTIHTFITLGILLSLVFGTWFQNFVYTTPYKDLLPPNSMFFAHPYQFLRQYVEVYGLHTQWNTENVMEKRKASVDDVQKRAEYRKAHGLDAGDKAGMFGGWTAKTDAEMMGPGLKTGTADSNAAEINAVLEVPAVTELPSEPAPKKWLGIW